MDEFKRFDVRREFAHCVERMGGVVLDDALVADQGKKPKNADFWFAQFNVIVELKCMEKDLTAEFDRRFSDLYAKWTHQRRVPPMWGKVVGIKDLPVSCQREAVPIFKQKVEAYVKEANKQIRATQGMLGRPDAAGVLMLVNDGNFGLPPDWVRFLLAHILQDKHRAVNGVVHASVNEPISVQGVNEPVGFWSSFGAPRTRPPVRQDFVDQFRDTWFRHVSETRGLPVTVYQFAEGSDPLSDARFNNSPKAGN